MEGYPLLAALPAHGLDLRVAARFLGGFDVSVRRLREVVSQMPCGWAGKARASTHAWICASMPSKLSSACGYLPSSAYLHAGAWLSGDRGAVHFQQPKRPQYHCPCAWAWGERSGRGARRTPAPA